MSIRNEYMIASSVLKTLSEELPVYKGEEEFDTVINIAQTLLTEDMLISHKGYDAYVNGFTERLARTPDVSAFITEEVSSINWLVSEILRGVENKQEYLNDMRSRILLGHSEQSILRTYYLKYYLRNQSYMFMRMIALLPIMRYAVFLRLDVSQTQPEKVELPKITQRAEAYQKLIGKLNQHKYSEFMVNQGKSADLLIEQLSKYSMKSTVPASIAFCMSAAFWTISSRITAHRRKME